MQKYVLSQEMDYRYFFIFITSFFQDTQIPMVTATRALLNKIRKLVIIKIRETTTLNKRTRTSSRGLSAANVHVWVSLFDIAFFPVHIYSHDHVQDIHVQGHDYGHHVHVQNLQVEI